MKLSSYFERTGETWEAFGQRIGVTRETVRRYDRGERIPEPEVMRRIHEATEGAVSANDFYGINDSPPSPLDGAGASVRATTTEAA